MTSTSMPVLLPTDLLRGMAFCSEDPPGYLRANPADEARLPADTWAAAQLPVGLRLELEGEARTLEITYRTETDQLGHRGAGAGATFSAWRGDGCMDEQPAVLGEGTVRLDVAGAGRLRVYLPEGMRPTLRSVVPMHGGVVRAPDQPRWLAYGDSITEGWSASSPSLTWTAVAARRHGLDVVNLGYAGAARAEIVSAEHLAALPADVISIAVGTNCWNRIPHSAGMMREILTAFLDIVQAAHPQVPVVVASPVLRPDAEQTPNLLGATLVDVRAAIEGVVRSRGDRLVTLVPGGALLAAEHLVDGVHPGDAGHQLMAVAMGGAVAAALAG